MARTQEELVELEAAKQNVTGSGLSSADANVASMSRDKTLQSIETSPRKPRAEKVTLACCTAPSHDIGCTFPILVWSALTADHHSRCQILLTIDGHNPMSSYSLMTLPVGCTQCPESATAVQPHASLTVDM